MSHRCGEAWSQPARGPLSQGGISLGSVAAFLVPVMTGIVGMALANRWAMPTHVVLYQAVGFVAGLVIGVLPAWLVFKLIRRRLRKAEDTCLSAERKGSWPRPDEWL